MSKSLLNLLLCAALLGSVASTRAAEDAPKPSSNDESADKDKKKEKKDPEDQITETKHSVQIGGQTVSYTATAGTIVLKEELDKPKATLFFIAYTKDGVEDPGQRPIMFSFNGGPGSSSVWLHLGALGPRRVLADQDGFALAPPGRLVDNEHSVLDLVDLVFIDPVTTGYSRPVEGEDPKQFHGVQQDVEWVGEFIRLYTTRFKRWSSPKFLIGESYGTTRAAALSGYLQERHGMYLNGIVLVSSVLNFQASRFHPGNDLPFILFLPTYTATAWYHKKLAEPLQSDLRSTLDQVERFALHDYTLALFQGDRLDPEQRQRIVAQLASFTGLSPEYIEQTNLRISIFRFVKELLRDQRRTVGRLDSRFKGSDADAAGESFEYDPSYAAIQGPFTAALNHYVRSELGFESDLPYEILTGRVRPWSYGEAENRYLNVAETLRQAMTQNPHLKVMVASGYYDLATPYFASDYTFGHLGLEPSSVDRVTIHYYESGHMMYIHLDSLARFKSDVAAFVHSALPQ